MEEIRNDSFLVFARYCTMTILATTRKLSFVIPCYNSAKTVDGVIDGIIRVVAQRSNYVYEIIAVVDGSPDDVAEVLRVRAREVPNLKVIELSRNFGQHNALMAGYNYATGDIIISLDDDGQCPIDRLWDLIAPLNANADVVAAKYYKKKQSRFKNFGSRLNMMMARKFIGIPKDFEMSNFFAFNSMVREGIIQYKGPYSYPLGLMSDITKRMVNVEMEELERTVGTTNYSLGRLVRLWLNGFTGFSIAPLRIADMCGGICAVLGFIYGIYIILRRLIFNDVLIGYSSLIAVTLFIGGVVMILLGLLGEYVGRIFISINHRPQFRIRSIVNTEELHGGNAQDEGK